MTENDQALSKQLGIQPIHCLANRLVDLADAKNREGYRQMLDSLGQRHGTHYQTMVNEIATRQIRMQSRDYRHNGWRVVWKEHFKRSAE
jgi:hypothetical protein